MCRGVAGSELALLVFLVGEGEPGSGVVDNGL